MATIEQVEEPALGHVWLLNEFSWPLFYFTFLLAYGALAYVC